jgi:serine/threonine-protein kinase
MFGTRLGPYEVTALIGVGGMGEVYRATDTNLGRQVAIKVLPEAFAHDPDRLARFEREAKTLASLNHPNIAAIYGLERSSASASSGQAVLALVMELVEGPTLADRIAQAAIPIDEALPIATQIAEALEAAHEQGIVHRDLKPANIKVRPDGMVKVLDFGLAKAMEPASALRASAGQALSQAPTITTPAMMTGVGMILGTAAYMSPEQARGKTVDKRADIWAFGCVLYEMLTGKRAFTGDDISDTLANVLKAEPDWNELPADVSARVRLTMRACLQKDPKQRIGDVQSIRLALEGAFETAAPQTVALASVRQGRRLAVLTGLVVGVAAATAAFVWIATRPVEPTPPRVSRLPIATSPATALTVNGADRDLATVPDGTRLVYVGNNGTQLLVRALDAIEPVAIFTGAPRGPFVSTDGQWIGFVDNSRQLKKIAVTGGPAITVATLDGTGGRGATWGPDDTIIFATPYLTSGLQQVKAGGGPTNVLTHPDHTQGEADHLWPEWLPGGRAVLFTITAQRGGLAAAQVAVLDLETGARKILVRGGSHAHYVSSRQSSSERGARESGYLIYAAANELRAVPFDLAGLETKGTPVPVISDVQMTASGGVDAVVARDGTLSYVSGGRSGLVAERTLVWVDREGMETPVPAPPRSYVHARISPDGRRVALFINDQDQDIWLLELDRAGLTRVTIGVSTESSPTWMPDGRRLVFASNRDGVSNLFWQAADGSGSVERLTESPIRQTVTAMSPDGKRLVLTETHPNTGMDVMVMQMDEPRRVIPLVQSPFDEGNGRISPDGRWLAYEANDSGRTEVHVRPFPAVDSGHWQVSTSGGSQPLWTRNGQELVFLSLSGSLMRVGVTSGASWASTTPTLVLKEGYYTGPRGAVSVTYDAARDGQRFLMIKEGGPSEEAESLPRLILVQNWLEELKRLVPTN